MATRADLLSVAAIKRARRAQSLAAVRPEKGDKGEDGKPGVDGLTVKGEPGEDGIGVAAVNVEQEDASGFDLVVTLTDQSKSRHHVKLPRGKGGKDGKDGSFWVRGGIANSAGTQQIYVLADIADPAPTYAGVPLLVFRPTGAADTYTMEIINS